MFWAIVIIGIAIAIVIKSQNNAELESERVAREAMETLEREKEVAKQKAERERKEAEQRAAQLLAEEKHRKIKESEFFKIIYEKLDIFLKNEIAEAIKNNKVVELHNYNIKISSSYVSINKLDLMRIDDALIRHYKEDEIYKITYNSIGYNILTSEESHIIYDALSSTGHYNKFDSPYRPIMWIDNFDYYDTLVLGDKWQATLDTIQANHKSQFKNAFE